MKIQRLQLAQNTAYAVVVLLPLWNHLEPTHAEGGNKRTTGDWGINRRVITNSGFAEVEGTVDITFGIPTGAPSDIDEWQRFEDSPTFYLGGNVGHEIDAGLQYDLEGPNKGMNHVDGDISTNVSKRGWHCFMRNNNPSVPNAERYNFLLYWDGTNRLSTRWNTYQAWPADPEYASNNITNAHLHFKFHQGIDPAVNTAPNTFVEPPGWMSLTFNRWELGAPTNAVPPGVAPPPSPVSQAAYLAGDRTAYWSRRNQSPNLEAQVQSGGQQYTNEVTITAHDSIISSIAVGDEINIGADTGMRITAKTVVTPTTATLELNTNFNTPGGHAPQSPLRCDIYTKTTIMAAIMVNPPPPAPINSVQVASVVGIRASTNVRIGSEWMTVAANGIDRANNKLTFTSDFTINHAVGEVVGWQQRIDMAHENHPVAPWFGSPAFDSNVHPSDTWQVKRVVGMTRRTGTGIIGTSQIANWAESLDGSWLESFFREGQVRPFGAGQSLRAWGPDDVLQLGEGTTGFDARANPVPPATPNRPLDTHLRDNGHLVFDQRCPPPPPVTAPDATPPPPTPPHQWVRTDTSRTIVRFPNLRPAVIGGVTVDGNTVGRSGDLDTPARRTASYQAEERAGVSRYTEEHMHINLRMGACAVAGGVAPVMPGTCPGGVCP